VKVNRTFDEAVGFSPVIKGFNKNAFARQLSIQLYPALSSSIQLYPHTQGA